MEKNRVLSIALTLVMGTVLFSGCSSTKIAKVKKVTDPTKAAWEQDKTPITLDWYINYNWFAGKWGEDLTTQYILKKQE